jgi:mono/diheme cytochrome c family protein
MRSGKITFFLLILAVVLVIAVFGIVWRPSLTREASAPSFQPAEIERGAQLAAIGNCVTCHTKPEGVPYGGGRPIATPFGTIYSTNITPQRAVGIGGWSEVAFRRAMKDGVRRDGHHLYPAFPYDHMTRMRDEDIRSVYAFMMTRRPVDTANLENELPFPFNIRALVAGWKLLFLERGTMEADAGKDAEWNRGAYLVEGLGHCGACHTPRNILGAENTDQAYAGGQSDGWIAPALNAASPAAVPWDKARLYNYFRVGFDTVHGVAAGPMAPVVNNLKAVDEAEVRAIAVYVADIAGAASPERQAASSKALARATDGSSATPPADHPGASVYAGACAQCHGEFGRVPTVAALNLVFSSTLRVPRPDNAIRIVREGIHPPEGSTGPVMPGFDDVLTDPQLTDLIGFLRTHFTGQTAWTDIDDALQKAKQKPTQEARSAQ